MGCLFSHIKQKTIVADSSDKIPINSKTIPLRRIPKLLYFKSIIPTEINFEVKFSSDGQYFLTQDNKEIRFGFTFNRKRWTVAQLQSMNYPTFDDNYRVTIGMKEFEALERHEHLLVPYDEEVNIDLEKNIPSIYSEKLCDMHPLNIEQDV